MSRFILIIVLGAFITYSITSLTQNKNVTQATENSVDNYAQTKARNLANSTAQLLMSQMADDPEWRVLKPATKDIFEGTATYTVTDTVIDGEDHPRYSQFQDGRCSTHCLRGRNDLCSISHHRVPDNRPLRN